MLRKIAYVVVALGVMGSTAYVMLPNTRLVGCETRYEGMCRAQRHAGCAERASRRCTYFRTL